MSNCSRTLLLSVLFMTSSGAWGQGSISGIVAESAPSDAGLKAIPGALIEAYEKGKRVAQTRSDAEGNYVLRHGCTGAITVVYSHSGYHVSPVQLLCAPNDQVIRKILISNKKELTASEFVKVVGDYDVLYWMPLQSLDFGMEEFEQLESAFENQFGSSSSALAMQINPRQFRGLEKAAPAFEEFLFTKEVVLKIAGVSPRMFFQAENVEGSEEMSSEKSIVEVTASVDSFSTFLACIKAADLVEALNGEGPYTVFVPTNEAFAKLPEGTVASLLESDNKQKLIAILQNHIVPGKVLASNVVRLDEVRTSSGTSTKIAVNNGKVKIGDATVIKTDVGAKNGVLHVIDSVLLPDN